MKKQLALSLLIATLVASSASASYIVILKNGNRYRAKERWTLVNGKALLNLENGTTLSIDPTLIDVAKTNEQNTSGLGDARLIGVSQEPPAAKQQTSTLGEMSKRNRDKADAASGVTGSGNTIREVPASGAISGDVLARFNAAYENVGIYGARITPGGGTTVKVELSADNEDQVFKALSATAYLIAQLPAKMNVTVSGVDLRLLTIKTGSAGRFNMTAADAKAIEARSMSLQQYYVAKVIF